MGRVGRLANNDTYIAGNNPNIVILFIADMFGWDFINNRLLADHFAREIRATVYVPDFFGGEVVASHIIAEEEAWEKMDLKGYLERNAREVSVSLRFSIALEPCLRNTKKSVLWVIVMVDGPFSDSAQRSTARHRWWIVLVLGILPCSPSRILMR